MNATALCLSICVLLSGSTTRALAAADVKWGRVQDNLQLGIEWSESSASGPEVRVLLRNVGLERREISTGFEGSAGAVYNVKMTAVSDAQPRRERIVFDLHALKAHPPSVAVPKIAHVAPGAAYVFTFPLSQLICVVDRKDVPLQDLLKRGYSIRASFEVSDLEFLTPDLAPAKE